MMSNGTGIDEGAPNSAKVGTVALATHARRADVDRPARGRNGPPALAQHRVDRALLLVKRARG
eukprot:11025859-Lingulodinium_polyedra.AAC.1